MGNSSERQNKRLIYGRQLYGRQLYGHRLYGHRLYGRRSGHRLHPRQARLVADMLPRLQPDLLAAHPPDDWFETRFQTHALEIGFGGGEHLVARAAASPKTGFIGCEPFINGVAKLLIAIEQQNLTNLAIQPDDARMILAVLPDASLDDVYLLYPDPWPKKRHHKRRFINGENLAEIFRVLKPQGRFLVASDSADYLNWTLSHMRLHGGFVWLAEKADDWLVPPTGWPGTRYEAKALKAGRPPGYLQFLRRAVRQPNCL